MRQYLSIIFLTIFSLNLSAQSGDCPGLCITADAVAVAATNGSSAELNAGNRGCLAAGEASSSYWFQVCFSANGTFQFYIDPYGNRNDFDFAIWNTATCPPTTAPIRCSYAGEPPGGPCPTCDYTGLGNGAVDNSEGAAGDGWLAPLPVVAGQCITLMINNYGAGSSNFDIFFGGTTATMTCAPLPVEMLTFNGINQGKTNVLSWSTATETANDFFQVERTIDGINWNVVDSVTGSGTTIVINNYSLIDRHPVAGTNYYRIKQVDYNGSHSYSNIVVVEVPFNEVKILKVYNAFGQEVDPNTKGLIFIYYDDGTVIKQYTTEE